MKEARILKDKLKKLVAYYKPYKLLFFSDMFFAILGAAVTLVIPLIVRHITNEVVYYEASEAMNTILSLGVVLVVLVIQRPSVASTFALLMVRMLPDRSSSVKAISSERLKP